ncbi:MAG: hypothetical protein JNL11_08980 [Bdellovibrionaceae bacterium]|nr:hypothetical protein [Pseudobdellovibrionaceae bacterium]
MKTKVKANLIIVTLFITLNIFAAPSKTQTEESSDTKSDVKEDLSSSFRCERLGGSIREMKLKMIDNCNLNKPFSSSLSRTMGGEDIYFYCCHKAN